VESLAASPSGGNVTPNVTLPGHDSNQWRSAKKAKADASAGRGGGLFRDFRAPTGVRATKTPQGRLTVCLAASSLPFGGPRSPGAIGGPAGVMGLLVPFYGDAVPLNRPSDRQIGTGPVGRPVGHRVLPGRLTPPIGSARTGRKCATQMHHRCGTSPRPSRRLATPPPGDPPEGRRTPGVHRCGIDDQVRCSR